MHTALSLILSAFHLPIDVKEKEKKGQGEKGEGEVDSSDTCKYVWTLAIKFYFTIS